jgi:hypothetical protein
MDLGNPYLLIYDTIYEKKSIYPNKKPLKSERSEGY